MRASDSIERDTRFAEGVLSFRLYEHQPVVHLLAPGALFASEPDWYYDFEYPREAERGLDFREDLFTCGVLRPGAGTEVGGHRLH